MRAARVARRTKIINKMRFLIYYLNVADPSSTFRSGLSWQAC